MTDIVKWLNDAAATARHDDMPVTAVWLVEAADEIKRLRAENNQLRAALRKIADDASLDVRNPAQYAKEVLGYE